MFKPVPSQFDFPKAEQEIRAFWEKSRIYEKSLEKSKGGKPFIFFEGPPTANGLPHPGHCLTRTIKDLFPRYKTMTGHYCLRKGGWDTHGLPVEVEVCKELGIHTKEEIEAYGVEAFNRKCLESVFRYTREWEDLTRRLGFWINLGEAYVTYHQSYVESVWWALKTLFDAGLLYQGHKIVWWWAQGGTALSAGEVGQGYREIDDPSVYVRFPLVQDERFQALFGDDKDKSRNSDQSRDSNQSRDRKGAVSAKPGEPAHLHDDPSLTVGALTGAHISLLVWTTTPWTLPSNMFAAVHADFEYALVRDEVDGERLIFAKALVESIAKKLKASERWTIERTFKGSELVGLRYEPPFPECYYQVKPAEHAEHFDPGGNGEDWDPIEGVFAFPIGDIPWGERHIELNDGSKSSVAWRVVAAPFVTLDAGTGLVHEAPAFGEVDFELLQTERQPLKQGEAIPLFCAVRPDGGFRRDAGDKYAGRWVKDCDKDICRDMKERGILVFQEQYRHDYPFCWRAEEDPLIQYPRRSWFIRTKQFKEDMLENNRRINWLPDHIKAGRFGKFLESNVDWSLSRERYWGTPLPIWVCQDGDCGHTEAVDSYDALVSKPGVQGLEVWEAAKRQSPDLSEHLKVHKPYIDAITYDCPKCASDQCAPDQSAPDQCAPDQSRDREGAVLAVEQGPLPDGRGSDPRSSDPRGRMKRVPEVIDCWFDSGAMPFAQWGYPHRNAEMFESQFPADFISEALDQTRGWFYSLTAISVMLFGENGVARSHQPSAISRQPSAVSRQPDEPMGTTLPSGDAAAARAEARGSSSSLKSQASSLPYPHPFKTCIVLGLLMGEDGLKMSKQKKNYKDPGHIFEHEGADAMRWLFLSGQTPWTSIRFQEATIAEGQREFLIRLYNCYSFFVIYTNIDKWTPRLLAEPDGGGTPGELDRWILSALNQCCLKVHEFMEAYDNYNAARALSTFVDALSNWYVRRSRDRFWKSRMDADKRAAYATLHECLVTLSRLIAPFTPFFAESMYQNLVRTHDPQAPESVHLSDYPITGANKAEIQSRIDPALNAEIERVRQLVSCGRAARSAAKLRVRQPLAAIELYHRAPEVIRRYEAIIKDELNVKRIDIVSSADIDKYVHYEVKPDFKKVGPKHGPLAPKIKAALAGHPDVDALVRQLERDGSCTLNVQGQDVELAADEVQVELHAKEGWSAERIPGAGILVLDTHLTPELRDEGTARDLVNQIQQVRKKLDLRYEQRIDLAVVGGKDVQRVVNGFAEYIRGETLAQSMLNQAIPGAEPVRVNIENDEVSIYVKPL